MIYFSLIVSYLIPFIFSLTEIYIFNLVLWGRRFIHFVMTFQRTKIMTILSRFRTTRVITIWWFWIILGSKFYSKYQTNISLNPYIAHITKILIRLAPPLPKKSFLPTKGRLTLGCLIVGGVINGLGFQKYTWGGGKHGLKCFIWEREYKNAIWYWLKKYILKIANFGPKTPQK